MSDSITNQPFKDKKASELSEDELAFACADSMWAGDNCSKALGFEIQSVSAGEAVLKMTVREDMLNGQKICHGGIMFLSLIHI